MKICFKSLIRPLLVCMSAQNWPFFINNMYGLFFFYLVSVFCFVAFVTIMDLTDGEIRFFFL